MREAARGASVDMDGSCSAGQRCHPRQAHGRGSRHRHQAARRRAITLATAGAARPDGPGPDGGRLPDTEGMPNEGDHVSCSIATGYGPMPSVAAGGARIAKFRIHTTSHGPAPVSGGLRRAGRSGAGGGGPRRRSAGSQCYAANRPDNRRGRRSAAVARKHRIAGHRRRRAQCRTRSQTSRASSPRALRSVRYSGRQGHSRGPQGTGICAARRGLWCRAPHPANWTCGHSDRGPGRRTRAARWGLRDMASASTGHSAGGCKVDKGNRS